MSKRGKKAQGPDIIASSEYTPDDIHIFDGSALLERSRSQWQLGDWGALAKLSEEPLENYSDRAKLALLAAAGFAQIGKPTEMKTYVQKAQEWGCSADLVARVLISGLQNGLGCAKSLLDGKDKSTVHFENSIALVSPHADTQLLGRARMVQEQVQLGLLPQALTLLKDRLSELTTQQALSMDQVDQFQQTLEKFETTLGQHENSIPLQIQPIQFPTDRVAEIMRDCDATGRDIYETFAEEIIPLTPIETAAFYVAVSLCFKEQKNLVAQLNFLAEAQEFIPQGHMAFRVKIAHLYLSYNRPHLAFKCLTDDLVADETLFDTKSLGMLVKARYEGTSADTTGEHGHAVLMAHLKSNPPRKIARQRLMIEIGTTRELIPGQGSTMKIAEFCSDLGMQFTTVDMDPYNSERAQRSFDKIGVPFTAVTAKGEDYLADYAGTIDFIFLDAYDFDHGNHSELRQSRYEAFLGARIDEIQCHKMHLDCAISLVKKLAPDGLICIDDTWQDDDGNWTAKGTTAVPFLLKNGFELVAARSRAALFQRKKKRARKARKS